MVPSLIGFLVNTDYAVGIQLRSRYSLFLIFQIFLLDGIYFCKSVDPLVLDWISRLLDASLHCSQCFLHLWDESPICWKDSFSINFLLKHFIN